LALLGIIRLLGVGYAPHTEFRTGSRAFFSILPPPLSQRIPLLDITFWLYSATNDFNQIRPVLRNLLRIIRRNYPFA
jgi:hypothetical protein